MEKSQDLEGRAGDEKEGEVMELILIAILTVSVGLLWRKVRLLERLVIKISFKTLTVAEIASCKDKP
jgi:hypothetical protein